MGLRTVRVARVGAYALGATPEGGGMTKRTLMMVAVTCAAAVIYLGASAAQGAMEAFVGPLHKRSVIASTVPANGDVNPYGVAVVPRSVGRLHAGDVLVSNFNAASNLQGTGTTIVQISPEGKRTTFAALKSDMLPGRCPGGVGLTTALGVLRSGWVIVGSLPTSDGELRDRARRLPDRARQPRPCGRDARGRIDQRAVGHGHSRPR